MLCSFARYAIATTLMMGVSQQVASAVEITVLDPSFEGEVRVESSAPLNTSRDWAVFGFGPNGGAGRQAVETGITGQQGPDVGFLDVGPAGGGGVWFVDAEIFREGTYNLTVDVASQPGREPVSSNFIFNIE